MMNVGFGAGFSSSMAVDRMTAQASIRAKAPKVGYPHPTSPLLGPGAMAVKGRSATAPDLADLTATRRQQTFGPALSVRF
jgi:hypothetical protein